MTKEEAADCIRSVYDAVISEYAASAESETRMRLEAVRVIEALVPEFLTDYEKETLAATKDAEIARLREALQPFADAAMDVQPGARDDSFASGQGVGITVGQLRHARDALAPHPEGTGE